jgi:predicted metal-binding membrane protein
VSALRVIGRRPTLWVEGAIVLAWALLLLSAGLAQGSGAGAGGSSWASGPLWVCMTGMGGMAGGGHGPSAAAANPSSLLAGAPMWALMAAAMMVPTAMPAVRHAAGKSLYRRRRRAAAEFLLVFVAIWAAFGVVVLGALTSWGPSGSPFALAAALTVAALWQLTPLKRRAQRACHRARPLPPRGWRASAGVADFALHNGTACVASCWAMMVAAALAGPGRLLWMGAMTGVMSAEKLNLRPERTARRIAALLAAATLGVLAAAVV